MAKFNVYNDVTTNFPINNVSAKPMLGAKDKKMASKALEVIMMLLLFLLTLMVNVYGIPHENALNLPQLLLPYAADGTAPTNYQLRAQRGCFKW